MRFGFSLAAVTLALVGTLSYLSVLRYRQDSGMVNHTHQVLNTLAEVVSSLTSAESAQRGYLVTGQQEYLPTYQATVHEVEQQLQRLRQLTADNPTQQQNLNALEPLVAERLKQMQQRLELRRVRGLEAAQSDMVAHGAKNVRDSIGVLVKNIENEEDRLLAEREAAAQSSSIRMRTAIVAGSAIAFGLLVLALFYVGQDIARSRAAEEELRQARDTLEERVRERTDEVIKSGKALRAGEERMARIIDSAMDAIITVDEQQRITMFNPAAERMFGCPATDAVGAPLERFLPPRFRDAHAGHIRGFGQNGVTRRTMGGFSPLRGLRTNGEEFPIEASISQVQVNGGKLYTAIVRDVTETAKARETSSKLAAIIESSDDAIISKTLDGVISSWNPAAEKLFGYTAAEAIGKRLVAFYPSEREKEEQEMLQRIAKGETIQHFESQRIRKDGRRIDVAVTLSPLRDDSGKVVGASKIARDITERKRAEEEIRQQASLLDLAPALVRDLENRIVLWTRGAEQLYKFKKQEALGRGSHELLQTEFPQPMSEIEKSLFAEGVWEGELRHTTRDGERVVVASQWVLYRDAEGRHVHTLEVDADITALKRAEILQLRSQKLEALGTLAGGIAHDFNNILGAINGSALLAISQFPPEHPVQACLVQIEKAGQRAADLVRRILSFSKPQEQNLAVQNLAAVVEEAMKLARATLPATIEIRHTFAPDLPMMRADTTQIHQVILNLATNAAHAIADKNGLIEVKVDAPIIREDEIQLYSQIPKGHYVRLSVSDNGSGMDAATVERIFDPFFTTKPTGKGTGLGLSVVHGIVTAHRGVVKVYSQPGKGTAFQIYFPAVQEAATPVEVERGKSPEGRGEHILFVDDESVLVFVGTMALEQKGYKVTGMSDGRAALAEFARSPQSFHAVVTDLSMPSMSGLQFVREIQKLRPDIPIILSSGYFSPQDQMDADRLGVRITLTKPVSPQDLLAALYNIFQEHTELDNLRLGEAG
ncbi:MAG: PAS domain S-box protein [Candidatus Acidiferrum sp.]